MTSKLIPETTVTILLFCMANLLDFNPKITAKQLVKNILRTFRPSTDAIFNANNDKLLGCYFWIKVISFFPTIPCAVIYLSIKQNVK